ncbi:hypothetical protein ABZ819_05340 [Streptomyces venezuelae]|uniref:hypothetical protein n=1 Tax=Streptomyces venezuelae TaxID=54571 RepID=UPI003416BCB0
MSSQWLAKQTNGNEVHVAPLDDVIVHVLTDLCPCGPSPSPSPLGDGSDGWVYTHHSLDGREADE